ncbi:hypothetical protein U9M48_018965, partial [Paspalum notatum var. saurae]
MIGSLSYPTATGPNIRFAVRLYARYQASPRTSHHQAVKHIFRYPKFTPKLGVWYSSGSFLSLRGFSDVDHAGCRIDRKNFSCLLVLPQASYDFGLKYGRIPLLVDYTSAISVAKSPVLHSRTKHIDVRFHFLRDHYEKGVIDLIHVLSANQLADIFTKPLEFDAFTHLR